MNYRHRFHVAAPLAAVAAFHRHSRSMKAITPPPALVRFQRAPELLQEGDELAFTLWLGPVPIPWEVQIAELSPEGFTDRLVRGPFRRWVHRHAFVPLGPDRTAIEDTIDLALRPHLWWGPVGVLLTLTLPLLFAFRSWKTRRLLEGGIASEGFKRP